MANVQVDAVPSRWEDSTPMAKALTRSAPIAGIAIILLALSSNSVLAWGDTAHRIICEIAYKELNSQARTEVNRLIRLDPDFTFFFDSCTWPDHPRKRSREHFVNLPRSATQLENDPCPLANKCVVTAIEADLKIVADAGATDTRKLDALKFLGHWVGDVHQPIMSKEGLWLLTMLTWKSNCLPSRSVSLRLAFALGTCSIRCWVANKREIRCQHSDIAAEDNLTSERFS